jgi:hypothetical protein
MNLQAPSGLRPVAFPHMVGRFAAATPALRRQDGTCGRRLTTQSTPSRPQTR